MQLKATMAAGSTGTFTTLHAEAPALVLRLAPLTFDGRWEDWAVSRTAAEQLAELTTSVSGGSTAEDPSPHARGVSVRSKGEREQWTRGGMMWVTPEAVAASDAAGVLGVRLGYRLTGGSGYTFYWRGLEEGKATQELVTPLLEAAAELLAKTELLGRYRAHLNWLRMGDIFRSIPRRRRTTVPHHRSCRAAAN